MYLPEWKKIFILIFGLLEVLIFSGTILGWTSLRLMLQKEGIYESLCHRNTRNSNVISSGKYNYQREQDGEPLDKFDHTETINGVGSTNKNKLFDSNLETNKSLMLDDLMPMESLERKTISLPTNNAYALKINFTIVNVNGSQNEIAKPFQKQKKILPRTIVIPFRSQETFDETFIYKFLNDSTFIIKSNTTETQVNLKPESNATQPLEQFIDFYLEENLELPSTTSKGLCAEQKTRLDMAFTISSFCMGAAAFIWGFLLEKWGLRTVRLIINGMYALGALMLCFASKGNDWIIFPALLTMSLSGVPIRISNMQIANLYPRQRSTIISVYSGAFSASSIVYTVLNTFHKSDTLNFFSTNLVLVFLSVLTIPFTLFVLPKYKVTEPETKPKKELEPKILIPIDQNHNDNSFIRLNNAVDDILFRSRKGSVQSVFAISQCTLQNFKPVSSPLTNRRHTEGFINEAYVSDETESSLPTTKNKRLDSNLVSPEIQPTNLLSNSSSPPLGVSLKSFAYNLHQMWFSWMITYMLLYVGTMNSWAQRITENPAIQERFLNIYGLSQVLALIISPMAGFIMDYQLSRAAQETDPMMKRIKRVRSGFWPLFITTVALIFCGICRFFDTQEFIYTSIVFVIVFRSFLLAVGSAFLRIRFHGDHFNRLLGVMSSVSAVISLLQLPIMQWENKHIQHVNIFNVIIGVVVLSNPLYLLITPLQRYFLRKEDQQH